MDASEWLHILLNGTWADAHLSHGEEFLIDALDMTIDSVHEAYARLEC